MNEQKKIYMQCKKCEYIDVCKYRDNMIKLYNNADSLISNCTKLPNVSDIHINCKFYTSAKNTEEM